VGGPELGFVTEEPASDLGQTIEVAPDALSQPSPLPAHDGSLDEHEELLIKAVHRARLARLAGAGDHTMVIMRELLRGALRRSKRKFERMIAALILLFVAAAIWGAFKIRGLQAEKRALDTQIQAIEAMLQETGQDDPGREQLVDRLNVFENQARALQKSFLYRWGVRDQETLLEQEIKSLLTEFGAEAYSLPPEFTEQVQRFIDRYQGPDRPLMQKALGVSRPHLDTVRELFQNDKLPPDLAYMILVESALASSSLSEAGAAGLWLFTAPTARAYGLKVGGGVDERLDLRKSTRAASRYVRDLILDFGSGSSVMLALAAYNFGPQRVKQAIRKVPDPIKQRDFWYLYRVRALPAETRDYVPKVIAAMIIGRSPDRFGF
jgi:soluble lytic murein transglycosylase-like protein